MGNCSERHRAFRRSTGRLERGAANPDRQTVVALMTHGSDTNVCSDDTFAAAQMAAGAFAATLSVKTAIISLLPSLAALGRVASAGGTRIHGINQASADARAETLAALNDAATPCDYPVPETPTPIRTRYALVPQLRLGPAGAFSNLFRIEDAEQCPEAAGGWFANNNADPTRVTLCPATCRSMTMTPGSAVRLLVGCLL